MLDLESRMGFQKPRVGRGMCIWAEGSSVKTYGKYIAKKEYGSFKQ